VNYDVVHPPSDSYDEASGTLDPEMLPRVAGERRLEGKEFP
jgi:hypothetical protein